MDAAQELIGQHGFSGTTVDAVLERTGLTKGAFFHHFSTKNELGLAVIQRFAERDRALVEGLVERAERLSGDPVQQLLIVVGLLEERAAELTDPDHGCLFASYVYENQMFDDEVLAIIERGFLVWRERIASMIRRAVAARPMRIDVDADELADLLNVYIEGAYVLAKSLGDATMLARQLRHYRTYLELLFGMVPMTARQ